MRRLFAKAILFELLIVFFISLTPLLWFKPGTILVGHDNTYPLAPLPFLANRLTTWTENFLGHDQSLILGTIPIHFIDAIPSFFGISSQTGQAIVYVFWFFCIGLAAYILAWELRPQSRLFRFTAVLLYQFNYFILQGWWIGEKSKFSAYIALPLMLAVIFWVTRRKINILAGAVIIGLIYLVFNAGGLYGVPLLGGAMVAIGALILLKFASYVQAKDYETVRRLTLFVVTAAIVAILANAYFLVPAFMRLRYGSAPDVGSVGGVSGVISWAAEISANASFINLFRLQGIAEWYDNPQHPYAKVILHHPVFIVISFLWPLLVFLSFFIVKRRGDHRIVTYFFTVYLLGLLFTAGIHPPLGFLYQLFVERVPGFVIFRSPYFKFAPAIFLASAYLIAYLIDSIPRRARTVSFLLLTAIVFVYHYPYFTGDFFHWREKFSTRLTIPSYVYEFGEWLNHKKSDDGRVLMLPPNSPDLRYSAYAWGYLSFQALPTLFSGKSAVINNDQLNPIEEAMLKDLYAAIERKDGEVTRKLASILHISYVVVQKDAINDPISVVPIDAEAYIRAIRENNAFVLERSFGMWEVFRLERRTHPKLSVTNRITSLQGDMREFDPYYGFIEDTVPLVASSDVRRLGAEAYASDFIVPACLTCPFKKRLVIQFPERNILPDDPFYQVVLILENRRPVPNEPKAAIYHLFGVTLKRISEINEMLYRQKPITKDIVDRYAVLLNTIEQKFQELPSLEEQIEVARDARDYLKAQRDFLFPNLNRGVPSGSQTVFIGRVFTEINRLRKRFELPELILDETRSRVYQFSLTREEEVEILVQTAEFLPIVREGDHLSVIIDNTRRKDIGITKDMLGRTWLSFGRMRLSSGFHTLTLLFPEPKVSMQSLYPVETEFTLPGDNACFGTVIGILYSSKLYKLEVRYLNDFSENLLLYTWDQEVSKRKLKNAVKLLTTGLPEKSEQIIEVSEGTKEALIALCAPNITQELIDKQFQLSVREVLFPVLLVYQPETSPSDVVPISFEQKSATDYRLSGVAERKPTVLVFSERYDNWWELLGASARHVQANGYANAWILEENTPMEQLVIRYKGEEYFFLGKVVSFLTVIGSIGYIGYVLLRRRRYHA